MGKRELAVFGLIIGVLIGGFVWWTQRSEQGSPRQAI